MPACATCKRPVAGAEGRERWWREIPGAGRYLPPCELRYASEPAWAVVLCWASPGRCTEEPPAWADVVEGPPLICRSCPHPHHPYSVCSGRLGGTAHRCYCTCSVARAGV